jgi:Domain of unknown function (DUF4383)
VIRRLEPVQWAVIAGALAILIWSIPGLLINPDFSTGDAATSKVVLGVDMNGWHALSGFPLALGALWFARRPRDAALYALLAAGALLATGIWALLDTRPAAGLFYFPHNHSDAWLHFAVAAIFLAGFVHYVLSRRGARGGGRAPSGPFPRRA